MRQRLGALVIVTLCSAGCATGPFARQPSAALPTHKPTTAQLVNHLNQNARAVQSIECTNVSIDAKQGLQPFALDASLAFEKPRHFRLQAYAVGSTQADFGSNEQEFWFWIKKGAPELFHCSHDDLPQCRNLRIPLQPDWIAEALCVTDLGAPEQYTLRTAGQNLELVTQTTSPQGQPLQKVTIVGWAGKDAGRVVRYHLRTPQGKDIWSAEIREHQTVNGVTLPRRVVIRCPDEKLEMSLKLDGCKVNSLVPGRYSPTLFARPQMPGVPTLDLARGPSATPQSIQRVRGASP